jgi:uncharacterized protein involved in exopolysaccharide biosynthesis
MARKFGNAAMSGDREGELDLRAIGRALRRRKWWIIAPTLIVATLAAVTVNLMTPKYKSETRILYDGRENIFLRPEAEKATIERTAADQEALTSQVQLVLSRELARQVIRQLKLNERPEFDPVLAGLSPVKQVLVLLGVLRDPLRMSPEERVLEAYYDRIAAYPVEKSRVIILEFQSADPELAAKVANTIAEAYLALQQDAKQDQTRAASQWLAGEIERLRGRVAEAEARAENFRSRTNLFLGSNNMNLSNQQLGEYTTQLAAARGQKADAETRARIIRDMLKRGEPIEASEIVNSELIRRLSEQRVTLRGQLAEQSSTLLDGHPRIKELKAQIGDLDRQIRSEAEKLSRALDNDARIAGARVEALTTGLDTLKIQAASTNEEDVQLRALEREAKAQRELLESYLAKFREASARESIGSAPADARVISRAMVSNTPFFPKKLPIVLVATLATLALSAGFVVTGAMLNASVPYRAEAPALVPEPVEPAMPAMAAAAAPEAGPVPALAPLPEIAVSTTDELAQALRQAGESGRRIALFAPTDGVDSSPAALALARALARDSLVVVVKMVGGGAIAGADADAPGLADLIRGSVSFGEVITRDKLSRVHLVPPGRAGLEPAMILSSLRFVTMIDALARTYDHVILDAGAVPDAALERAAKLAPRGVLLAEEPDATHAAQARLAAAGYGDLALLTASSVPTPQPEAA